MEYEKASATTELKKSDSREDRSVKKTRKLGLQKYATDKHSAQKQTGGSGEGMWQVGVTAQTPMTLQHRTACNT